MSKNKKILFLIISISSVSPLFAPTAEPAGDIQIKVGNFSVPGTQQPGPLFGFGQAVIDKGDTLVACYSEFLTGYRKQLNFVIPYVMYGITPKVGLLIGLPVATKLCVDDLFSSGVNDLFARVGCVIWSAVGEDYVNALSLLIGGTLPTGAPEKIPATGFGAPSCTLGFQGSHLDQRWYSYTEQAVILTPHFDDLITGTTNRAGNFFLYQFGIGRNIFARPGLIVNWLVELTGLCRGNDIIEGCIDPNSGGNVILLAPSFLISTEHVTFQFGIGGFITQHFNGHQNNNRFIYAFNVSMRHGSGESWIIKKRCR